MVANLINYLLLIALVTTGLLFYNDYILAILLAALIIMPVISIVLFYKTYKNIKIKITDFPVTAGRNNDIKFKILVKNESFYPMGDMKIRLHVENIFYGNEKIYILNVANVPFKSNEITWKFKSLYCGCIKVDITEVEVRDFLGIVRKKYAYKENKTMVIMPVSKIAEFDMQALSSGDGDESEVQYKKGTDVSDISQIRPYEPGDSLQSVHWKLTARYDEWMVKEYSMPYTNRLCLILELYNNSDMPDEMDSVIEAYIGYALFMINNGREFYMVWYNSESHNNIIREIQTENDVMLALNDIMYVKPSKNCMDAYYAYKNEYGNSDFTGLYVTNASNELNLKEDKLGIYSGKAVIYGL